MRLIAITKPEFWAGEAPAIMRLLEEGGFWRVHIRKPGAQTSEVERLILAIPPRLRPRLTVHYHFELAQLVGGVHLNSRNPSPPQGWMGLVSRSCHSLDELTAEANYLFLSPIFDSISKPGYRAAFSAEELRGKVDGRVFALGGVTFEQLPYIQELGFGGAAMLGAAWR